MSRQIKYHEALREAVDLCMGKDPSVYIMGLGVPDPKGIFGTTNGLLEKYGPQRVQDMPLSENAMTGVAIGSALVGQRPILTHQRMDFALVAMEQMVNQAAKWHYMYGGQARVPLVIRMIIGRGWGQGPQHSQSLQAWFAHIPGLRVVMPTTAHDAKGMMIAAVESDDPVIYLEHRWLYGYRDVVPEEIYRIPLDKARIMRAGKDVTIVATSYMALEALRAAEILAEDGLSAEVIDLRSIRPLDTQTILDSVHRTGRLIVCDTGGKLFGVSAEIVATVAEELGNMLKAKPVRIASPDSPTPTSPALANHYYPRAGHVVVAARQMLGLPLNEVEALAVSPGQNLDQPDSSFTGPF
jgi:acetoin:2,6-dichlorophenolindophenol oxidoreductase subunit beta